MAAEVIETAAGLSGTLDVIPYDADGNPSQRIWDRTMANRLDCTIVLTGAWAGTYHNADSFSLLAYFDPVATGGIPVQVPAAAVPFLGSAGTLAGAGPSQTLTFVNPPVGGCSISVPASDPTLPAGSYRVTVVLSHTPAGPNPRIAGFYDMGIIQLF
jgi:hypothetical protein